MAIKRTAERVAIEGMTEAEADLLFNLSEAYWKEFSQLVARHLSKAPHYLQDLALTILEDKSSAHGSDFLKYMKRPPPFMRKFHNILNDSKIIVQVSQRKRTKS